MPLPDDLVMVRVDVEGLKHHVVHAFQARAGDMTKLIQQEVDTAIRTFNWQEEVAKISGEVIRDVVKHQISNAMSHLRWDDNLRKELTKAVLREMTGQDPT